MSGSLHAAVQEYAEQLAPAVAAAVRTAAREVPAVADRLTRAGLSPQTFGTSRSEDRAALADLPVISKDDVLARQLAEPPFGGMLAPTAQVHRLFQSPGPIYEPQLDGPDPWRWGQALVAAGFCSSDTVLNCFGYHLSPAGAMFEQGSLALGARVVPGGIGNQDLQARAVADLGVTAYTGLPSYLKAVVERYDELGLPRDHWHVARALVTAEPLPDSLRELLTERVPTVLMAYGTAETGLIAFESAAGKGLVPADGIHVEVCDLDSGQPVSEGEGQVVVTLLRPDYPLIRFGTGDLSAWTLGPDGDLRLAGVLGRVGAAVKVRGMFLHPRQAEAVLAGIPGVRAWRFVVSRQDHRDTLTCEIAVDPDVEATTVADEVRTRIRSGLRFTCAVTLVPAAPSDGVVIADERDWS